MRRPTVDQMRRAAAWLDCNEGDEGEADDCAVVARWLCEQADAAELRALCRAAGLPVSDVRAALAEPQP